jgi:Ran GTPase-activating protein (RanGAP) involved in mRNA processing and transport
MTTIVSGHSLSTAFLTRLEVILSIIVLSAAHVLFQSSAGRVLRNGKESGGRAGVQAQCPALDHLNLSRNAIGDAGAEILAGVLAQGPTLARLHLSYTWIGEAGTESLARVLAQCTALTQLGLYNNDIGASGVERFAGVLGQCSALAHLDLRRNRIGNAGAESLAQCPALTQLELGGNKIIDAGQRVLQTCWSSAQRWLFSNSAKIRPKLSGKRVFELRGVVKPLVFFCRQLALLAGCPLC